MERPRILLADDSVTIRKVVELTFADEGIDVVSVGDGDAAMVSFVANEPDLVIADVNMPGIGGYTICEMIKQDESTREIPVILLTGSFEPFDPGEASRVGANYYFTKPFQSIRELVNKVRDLLDTKTFNGDTLAETEDIDGLYKDSFADTLKIEGHSTVPELNYDGMDAEIAAHQAEAIAREKKFPEDLTVAGLGYEGMDDEISVRRPEAPKHEEEFPKNLTVADLGYEGMDDEISVRRPEAPKHEEEFPKDLTVADLGYEGMDDEISVHRSEPTKHEEEFPENLTVADLGYEGMDDESFEHQPDAEPEKDFPANLTVADLGYEGMNDEILMPEGEDRVAAESRPYAFGEGSDPFSVPIDLGDASLDDEMIETSRPGEVLETADDSMAIHVADTLRFETPQASAPESRIDPFETPITADDMTAKFNWADEAAELVNEPEVHEPSNLKFEIVDNDEEVTFDPGQKTEGEPETLTPEDPPAAHVYTPELIELIAQRVIEHLSDKVIREVAMEVVPKITEDMIREALENESIK